MDEKFHLQIKMILIYNLGMNSRPRTFASHTPDAAALKPSTTGVGPSALGVARLSSHAIFAGALEVEIEHNGVLYRLRQTSLGKLILTK